MKQASLTIILFSVITLAFTNCKKGDPGPEGPQGEQGEQGEQGVRGATGTANVIYSAWRTATAFNNDTTIDGSKMRTAYLAASGITNAILTSGTVIVYLNWGAGTFPMPYTGYASGKASTISYTPMLGKILITRFTHDNTGSVILSTAISYRYIIIPGGVVASRQAETLDYNDYSAVCAYYGIPE